MTTKTRHNSFSLKIQLIFKRLFDITVALIALCLLSPLLLLIGIAVKITSKGTVLFLQDRVGKDAKIFKLYKFRTMVPGAINIGAGLSVGEKDPRITKVGSFLRKTSLDEIPQLLNVLKGDISLVGPRPTVPEHLKYYGNFERRRLEIKPGITGLAMVRGRATIPWSERIKYDVEYVDNFSLWLDLKIILQTVWIVSARKNVYFDYENFGKPFDLKKPDNKT
jgi:lipopolysaccharide/colanic/teichoic acid biosynthesis glycosyltransferase